MDDVITKIIGNVQQLNRNDYKICMSALLGYTPNDLEVDILYEEQELLSRTKIINIAKKYLSTVDREMQALEVFRALDSDGKGYINIFDLHKVWKYVVPSLKLRNVVECFEEISTNNMLSYNSFKFLFLNSYNV